MKNMKRMLAMTLVVMMLAAMLCVTNVSATVTSGKGQLWVSHFNQEDVYANSGVIFTKEFMGDKTLQDITSAYVAEVSEKLNQVDAEWANKNANHGFNQYYAMVCVWNEENSRYEVQQVATTNACSTLTCPDNGFIFAMHHDDDTAGTHNYPSQEIADKNFGDKTTVSMSSNWRGIVNQPVYLYNIDLEKLEPGSGIVTSGTFDSKMSPAGLNNGLVEIYENFKTESYIMVGEEDANATVEYYEPKNITVSFSRIDKLVKDYEDLDRVDYNDSSWKNLEDAINKYDEAGKAALDNKGVKAWAEEIEAAMDALVLYEEGDTTTSGENDTNQNSGVVNPGEIEDEGDFNVLYVIIPVIVVLVIAGVVFLVVAMKKDGKNAEEKTADEKEEKKEESSEEPKE